MSQLQKLSDSNEICRLVADQIAFERDKYECPKQFPNEQTVTGNDQFTSDEIIDALNRNEDGDTWLYIELYRDRFCYDTAASRWYKWSGHFWEEDILNDAMRAVDTVIAIYATELNRLSWEQQKEALGGSE